MTYVGHELVKEDIANFKAALSGATVADAYLPAVTPGTIEHWLQNEFYPNDEAFLFAIADALRPEYQAIVEAGFTLQIDDPDLPDGWQIYPDMSVADYRKYADLRVEALNHALKGIPADKVRCMFAGAASMARIRATSGSSTSLISSSRFARASSRSRRQTPATNMNGRFLKR